MQCCLLSFTFNYICWATHSEGFDTNNPSYSKLLAQKQSFQLTSGIQSKVPMFFLEVKKKNSKGVSASMRKKGYFHRNLMKYFPPLRVEHLLNQVGIGWLQKKCISIFGSLCSHLCSINFFSSIPPAGGIFWVPFSTILKAKLLFEPWRKQAQEQIFLQVNGLSLLYLNSCISNDRSTQTLASLATSLLKSKSSNVITFHT